MLRKKNNNDQAMVNAGQAAIELAVFGAILVFILGTIVRTAVGNGYEQNQDFKAMRMAMLASWNGSKAANMSRNSASVLFVEDRLSPDINKYELMERNPFVADGSGTFSYELLYPLDSTEVSANLPIMDVYINGQYFPFTMANYFTTTLTPSVCSSAPATVTYPLTQAQCLQNQCLRNAREWAGGTVSASLFDNVIPITVLDSTTAATMASNAGIIFNELTAAGLIDNVTGSGQTASANVSSLVTTGNFISAYASSFPGLDLTALNQIQTILQANRVQYKWFWTQVVNGTQTPPYFSATAPDTSFDLQRNNDPATFVPLGLRPYIAWQWFAVPGTTPTSIGLDPSSNQYPSYDIDGRLKMVTIFGLSQDPTTGYPTVTYEDFQKGDIDGTWDQNTCAPKPGLQPQSQIYTFTQDGTYLLINEGKLYNPETDQFVRSVSKRDTIDLVQRTIQLSYNTGRFCDAGNNRLGTVANDGVTPNQVEVCLDGVNDNCFTSAHIAQTCFDASDNRIFVRSRLEDLRGHYWMTDTAGQMSVK